MSGTAAASVADRAQGRDVVQKITPFLRRNPEIWVAIVLWLASNVFVTGIAKFATWEGGARYHSAADLCQWDCGWYGSVVEGGYDHAAHTDGTANWPFHPAFPATAYPFRNWLKLPLGLSMVFASKAALLFAIYGFILLAGQPLDSTADHVRAGSLVAFNPYLIYAHAGYAEPLYFALAAMLDRFKQLHYGLGAILAFAALKMLLSRWIEVPVTVTLAVIGAILAVSAFATGMSREKETGTRD